MHVLAVCASCLKLEFSVGLCLFLICHLRASRGSIREGENCPCHPAVCLKCPGCLCEHSSGSHGSFNPAVNCAGVSLGRGEFVLGWVRCQGHREVSEAAPAVPKQEAPADVNHFNHPGRSVGCEGSAHL